ncbi:MAG: response regulator [bacterium]|nr:response regulator [bacterium]
MKQKEQVDSSSPGLVLLIDDEEVIREIGVEMVNTIGMECIAAETGEEGIKLYEENKEDICLVILDIELPGICGNEVFVLLEKLNPDVKVLFVSGYTKKYIENKFFQRELEHFMAKPFQLNLLTEEISTLLNS